MTRVAFAFLVLCGVVAVIGAARARSEESGLLQETLVFDGGRACALPAGSGDPS